MWKRNFCKWREIYIFDSSVNLFKFNLKEDYKRILEENKNVGRKYVTFWIAKKAIRSESFLIHWKTEYCKRKRRETLQFKSESLIGKFIKKNKFSKGERAGRAHNWEKEGSFTQLVWEGKWGEDLALKENILRGHWFKQNWLNYFSKENSKRFSCCSCFDILCSKLKNQKLKPWIIKVKDNTF